MARWMLDANIISHAARNPDGPLAARIGALADEDLCTSIVVAGELRFGLSKKGSPKLTQSVEAVLSVLTIEPLQPPADQVYGDLRARLEEAGQPMGANDLWIAAHALALGCTLVTDDGGFDRVAGLQVVNWLRRD
jgi:tRNA(fMet)-specific endonuclease VapC